MVEMTFVFCVFIFLKIHKARGVHDLTHTHTHTHTRHLLIVILIYFVLVIAHNNCKLDTHRLLTGRTCLMHSCTHTDAMEYLDGLNVYLSHTLSKILNVCLPLRL